MVLFNVPEQYQIKYFTANNIYDFNIFGYFFMHFSHGNLLHLGLNMFVLYGVLKVIFKFLNWNYKDVILYHIFGILFISISMYIYLNYFIEKPEAHLGYSALFLSYIGYIFYVGDKSTKISLAIQLILFSVLFEMAANISHIGHTLGFIFGLIYGFYNPVKN
tara:strand:- start:39943 stop:40428 length:486 start_codon:yes stop_codon:yes gene_type:complete